MSREPLLLPAAALAVGIVTGHFHPVPSTSLVVPWAAAMALLIFSLLIRRCVRLRLPMVLILFLIAGIFMQGLHRNIRTPKLNVDDGEAVLISGCISNPPVFSPDREQFTLDLKPQTSARISVNLKNSSKLPLQYGQHVEVAAKIRSPRNFGNPDAFDYVAYLAGQHIYWTGSVSSPTDIHTVPGRCGSRAVAVLYNVRTWALERLQALYPGDQHTTSLLQATLLGETSGVEKRWTSDFRVTGTYHALVISGQHVSVLAGTLLLLLRLLRLRRIPALYVATTVSWLYAFISGFSSPVVRAAGGFTLFLIASFFFRKTRILNVLAAIAIIYLLFDPTQLFDPSFQLSFLSAAAIAAFAVPVVERFTEPLRQAVKRFDQIAYDPQVEERAAQWRVELRLLARTVRAWTSLSEKTTNFLFPKCVSLTVTAVEAVIISACVQFGLALPMVTYFHRLSITGLSANILVIPLLSAVVPLGFASLLTMWRPLAFLTKLLLGWAEGVASWHVQFEPSWRIAAVPLPIALAFAVALITLAWTIRHRRRYLAIPLTCSLALFAALCRQPWKPQLHPHRLEVTAIDVGQGDSIFLAFPDGTTMLIDAGGFPGFTNMAHKPQLELGEDVISPYLWSRRIRHIDYAVLTHGHSDHMGGLAAILDNFRPDALWIGAEPETEEWKTVQQHAAADRVKIVSLNRASAPVHFGEAQIRVLAPSVDYSPGDKPHNNDSLILEVSYRNRRVLLTGDAERMVENELVNSGELRPVTLLKVGHHGSKTSSTEEFLNATVPQFAFISDGYKNQFHHPHPTVLQRLAEHKIKIFRTDEHGLATFITDGDKVELSSFR